MTDYIKREDAINLLIAECKRVNDNEPCEPCDDCFDKLLSSIPSADVVERKHGEWILEYEPNGKPYCFHCSVCDGDFHYIGITTAYPFCPNCGAEMRGAE